MGEAVVAFRVPSEIKTQVEQLATKMGKSTSELLRDVATILALSNKLSEAREALFKFVDMITDVMPDMYRTAKIDLPLDYCTPLPKAPGDHQCYAWISFKKDGSIKEIEISIERRTIFSDGTRGHQVYWKIWYEKSGNTVYVKYMTEPPKPQHIDIVIEAIKAILSK